MYTTLQKERDTRLPYGFDTWMELLRYCQNIPELNEMIVSQNRQDEKIKSIVWDMEGKERFECDVMTLKLRAFEEILPLLPTADEAYHSLADIQSMCFQTHSDVRRLMQSKIMQILDHSLKSSRPHYG